MTDNESQPPPSTMSVIWGVTPPVSLAKPNDLDISNDKILLDYVNEISPLATEEDNALRRQVMLEIEKDINSWLGKTNGVCRLLTSGSQILNIIGPSSDLDLIVLLPTVELAENIEYLKTLVSILSLKYDSVYDIFEAYVPIISFKCRGIDIDLMFSSVNRVLSIEKEILNESYFIDSSEVFHNLSDKHVRTINGYRVSMQMLKLVPNIEVFRLVLRYLKVWAKKREIYSNSLGYLGGVSWAILAARICQLFPNFNASQIITRMFNILSRFDYANYPVILKNVEKESHISLAHLTVWDPISNPSDAEHLMPILTPAYPAMNSTHNVSNTTFDILLYEFQKAANVFDNASTPNIAFSERIEQATKPLNINQFKYFIDLQVISTSDLISSALQGALLSKVRLLVKAIERSCGNFIRCRPIPKEHREEVSRSRIINHVFIALCVPDVGLEQVGMTHAKLENILLTQIGIFVDKFFHIEGQGWTSNSSFKTLSTLNVGIITQEQYANLFSQ